MSKDKRKTGRPPLDPGKARSAVFTLRLTEQERAALDAAAEGAGEPVSRWARRVLLEAAGGE